ncbi:MAG: response regulator [Caulobacteraceae bacterium]|nr:response regulator [Caulobacteraceae bacterium]
MRIPSILVIEDEALVALDLEFTLEEMGWSVAGSLGGVGQALAWLDREPCPDAALLDVNLGGETVFPVAKALAARRIPFAFATGYADMVARSDFSAAPTLIKPVDRDLLKQVLDGLLGKPAGAA